MGRYESVDGRMAAAMEAEPAIAAGANRVNSLAFNLRDDTGARNDAIARAASACPLLWSHWPIRVRRWAAANLDRPVAAGPLLAAEAAQPGMRRAAWVGRGYSDGCYESIDEQIRVYR
jgi:hypothetical protein